MANKKVQKSYNEQLSQIESQLKGTRFEQLAAANPYKRKTEYTNNLFSKAGTEAREQLMQNSLLYAQDLLRQFQEEQYNSEEAKVQRLRDAGLNPDLQGLESASDAPAPAAMPEFDSSTPGNMSQDALLAPYAIGQTLIQGVSQTVGILKQFQDIELAHNQAQSFDLDNLDKIDLYARKVVYDIIPWDDVMKLESDDSTLAQDITSSMDAALDAAVKEESLGPLFRNPINFHRYTKALSRLRSSPRTKADLIKFKNEYISEREQYTRSTSSRFFSADDATFKKLMKSFVDYDDQIKQIAMVASRNEAAADRDTAALASEQATFESSALGVVDPITQGSVRELENENALFQARSAQATLKLLDDITTSLMSGYEDGGIKGGFCALGLVLLTFFKSQMFTSMASSAGSNILSSYLSKPKTSIVNHVRKSR